MNELEALIDPPRCLPQLGADVLRLLERRHVHHRLGDFTLQVRLALLLGVGVADSFEPPGGGTDVRVTSVGFEGFEGFRDGPTQGVCVWDVSVPFLSLVLSMLWC